MERKIGLSSRLAFSKASGPQGYQSTGLWACCRRYGLFSWINRLVCCDDDDIGASAYSLTSSFCMKNPIKSETKRSKNHLTRMLKDATTPKLGGQGRD